MELSYPIVVNSYPEGDVALTHFEIVYWRDTHYDSVISKETGNANTVPTAIPTIDQYTDGLL